MDKRPGKGANTNQTITKIRRAATIATTKFAIGGGKRFRPPKPITLPKLKFLEDK